MRVNTSLLAICAVDAWLLYKGTQGARSLMTPNKFYGQLAEHLIDNKYGITHTRSARNDVSVADIHTSGIGPHLKPTSRKRKRQDGSATKWALQGRCKICKNGTKTKYVCSSCTISGNADYWLCHSSTGRECFIEHFNAFHIGN